MQRLTTEFYFSEFVEKVYKNVEKPKFCTVWTERGAIRANLSWISEIWKDANSKFEDCTRFSKTITQRLTTVIYFFYWVNSKGL